MSPPDVRRLVRPLQARDPNEDHRVATPLELLTDLCFVVAVSQAAAGLHHAISDGHPSDGVVHFLLAFFGIFWAWLNFTWFSSAYDNDDLLYRLLTILQIVGSLVYAAGIGRSFAGDLAVGVVGYVIMRVALVTQWLRVARQDSDRRTTALRFAFGITLVQLCWVAFLLVPGSLRVAVFVLLACGEMSIPPFAERAGQTTWHPHHVAERYSLFFIIVLGETVLSTTGAVQAAMDEGLGAADLIALLSGGVLLVFSLWWIYFSREDAGSIRGTGAASAMTWGYGHFLVFAPAAALGAGLAVRVDRDAGVGHANELTSAAAVTVPVAVLLAAIYTFHLARHQETRRSLPFVVGAIVLVLASTWTPVPEVAAGIVCALVVTLLVVSEAREPSGTPAGHSGVLAGEPVDNGPAAATSQPLD